MRRYFLAYKEYSPFFNFHSEEKRSLPADFSACGWALQRHLPCPPQCDPAEHFCIIGRNFL